MNNKTVFPRYKVQQLNLATNEIRTVLRTDELAEAMSKLKQPGSCYRRVIECKGRSKFLVVAKFGAAAL